MPTSENQLRLRSLDEKMEYFNCEMLKGLSENDDLLDELIDSIQESEIIVLREHRLELVNMALVFARSMAARLEAQEILNHGR